MAELLFYKKPVALNREEHKNFKFLPVKDFSFTNGINSVPLTGIEFFEASRELPVLFSKDGQDNFFPLALLSLMNNGHKLISDEGEWQGSYVPAFIRRYPFALTEEGTVCFDSEYAQINADQEEGKPLFNEEGENSESLANIVNFLQQFDQSTKATAEFTKKLAELDLFKPFTIQIMTPEKKPLRMEGLYVIDEAKVAKLDDEIVLSLFKTGQLAWVYAHLHSLGALRHLSKKQQEA
ncbi:SapC family protein [Litoribrevibacter euphylliae]|uniref:SapC family protein n=1 Tax=Litoribrevibacter euphylliae TaxID=1834034 RepID=A0ABV7HL51_9GAMM